MEVMVRRTGGGWTPGKLVELPRNTPSHLIPVHVCDQHDPRRAKIRFARPDSIRVIPRPTSDFSSHNRSQGKSGGGGRSQMRKLCDCILHVQTRNESGSGRKYNPYAVCRSRIYVPGQIRCYDRYSEQDLAAFSPAERRAFMTLHSSKKKHMRKHKR